MKLELHGHRPKRSRKKSQVADSRGAKEPNKSSGLHEKAILLRTIDWRQLAFIQTASRCRLIYMAVLLPLRTFSNSKLPVREKVKAMKQIILLLAARRRRNKSPAGVSLNLLAGELFHNRGRASGTPGRRPRSAQSDARCS